jgi:integrin-linked kinase-associated serine/threonine phosphatase 2C
MVERQMIKSGIDYNYSGTCANIIFIKDDICTISNLGDSRAVLCRINKDINAIEMSWDHKPTRKDEKARIITNEGRVEKLNYNGDWIGPYRVWIDDEGPGYGMTRTLGDTYSKKIGLISKPEIEHIKLKKSD